MRVIIDIPEDVYTRFFDNDIQDNEIAVDDVCEMARALRLGKPLDDLRAEFIDRYPKNYAGGLELGGASCVFSLNKVLEIIDKYAAEIEPQEIDREIEE